MVYSEFTYEQDSMINNHDYVELGLSCANVCRAIDRGMSGRRPDDISRSAFDAITQLTM